MVLQGDSGNVGGVDGGKRGKALIAQPEFPGIEGRGPVPCVEIRPCAGFVSAGTGKCFVREFNDVVCCSPARLRDNIFVRLI